MRTFLALILVSLTTGVVQADGNYAAGRIRLADATIAPRLEPNDVGRSAPALAEFGGRLYMAWRGNHDEYNVVLGVADLSSGNLEEKITFPEATNYAPALAVFQGSLVIAWTGLDHHLRAGRVDLAGRGLHEVLRYSSEAASAPALAAFPDRLILGWRDLGDRLQFGRVDFGTDSLQDRVSPSDQKIRAGPSLAVTGGALYVGWTEENRRLSLGYFNGAPHPASNPAMATFRNLNESSAEVPALAILDGVPRLAWTGTDRSHRLNVAMFDLATRRIVGSTTFADTSNDAPALAAIGGDLAIAWRRTPKGHREIRIRFPNKAPQICGEIEIPNPTSYPADQRHGVVDLFNIIYPEIVEIYGEPVSNGDVDVKIYHYDGSSSMYLSHKADNPAKVIAVILAASLGQLNLAACVAMTEMPDQVLFLSELPDEATFGHLFTHEIIHSFHDRMDFIGWYDRSWIEEGMTEAAAQLVALRLFRRGGRDVRGEGIKRDPASALKHYDVWSYPFNGAWDGNHPGFSILGGIQFFLGGVAIPKLGDEKRFNYVLDPDIRYSAAASLWQILTRELSKDPFEPDFLKRLNLQLLEDNVREMSDDSSETLLREIQKVARGRTVEGQEVRQWLLSQALLKGAPAGHDFLFIDVRNPENLNLAEKPITIYAIAKEDLPNPGNPFGQLSIGELPARNCTVRVVVRDVNEEVWIDERGLTDRDGKFGVQTVRELPPGAYAIYATADDCDRVHEGPFQSRVPNGLSASTYAIVSGKPIAGHDPRMLGATVRPHQPSFFPGSRPKLAVVGASVTGFVLPPFEQYLGVEGTAGAFSFNTGFGTDLSRPESYAPTHVQLAQTVRDGHKNPRTFLKPNPFTRVVWLGTTPDFFFDLEPVEATLRAGTAIDVTAVLVPSGVRRGEMPGCPIFILAPVRPPAGVSVEMPRGFSRLSQNASSPTLVPTKIRVDRTTAPGTYDLKFQSYGALRTECEPMIRTAMLRLHVLPVDVNRRKDNLTFGEWDIDVDLAVTYTDIQDPEFHIITEQIDIEPDPPPDQPQTRPQYLIREKSRHTRAGDLALLLTAKHQRARRFGPQLGFGFDAGNPSIFGGVAFALGDYIKISGGRTWQRVTKLTEGYSLNRPVKSETDLSTREGFDNGWYAALSITIDNLPIFNKD